MSLGNTDDSYGLIARILHWLTALLIFVAFPLGFLANRADLVTDADIERVFALFSLHKTVGIAALVIGLTRIGWSLTQTRPNALGHSRPEQYLAGITHRILSIALVLVPLTGWLAHSAAPGLAPIRWPFGQYLPLVPSTADAAAVTGAIHWLATKLLAVAIVLHIAGALKHAIIDRDGTLARMTRGTPAKGRGHHGNSAAILIAVSLWAATIGIAASFAPRPPEPPVAWIATDMRVELRSAVTGETLGDIPAADVRLTLDDDDMGTIDIFAALDSATTPDADPLLAALPIPVAQFSAPLSGAAPDLTAAGQLELGGQVSSATIEVSRTGDMAVIAATMILPPAPDFALHIEASFRRPAE
ncbi:cytochrome b [Silicimonas sp. MF1-12-2]|uniref:cytochrome b n=1 Tax=Silicimonas sp. MF1-12-2 TaxID=3384793 RepID=UPI0039B368CE